MIILLYNYYYYFTIIFIIINIVSIIIIYILTILINNCQTIFLLFQIVKNTTLPKKHYSITLPKLFLDLPNEPCVFKCSCMDRMCNATQSKICDFYSYAGPYGQYMNPYDQYADPYGQYMSSYDQYANPYSL
jgi:hypothetical protein